MHKRKIFTRWCSTEWKSSPMRTSTAGRPHVVRSRRRPWLSTKERYGKHVGEAMCDRRHHLRMLCGRRSRGRLSPSQAAIRAAASWAIRPRYRTTRLGSKTLNGKEWGAGHVRQKSRREDGERSRKSRITWSRNVGYRSAWYESIEAGRREGERSEEARGETES